MTKQLFSSVSHDARAMLSLGLAALLLGAVGDVVAQAQPQPQLQMQLQMQSPAQRAAATRTADYIVAVVNSEPITNHEVNARRERIEAQMSRQGVSPEPNDVLRETLERLILERAQLQLARSLKIQPDEAAVDQAVAGVARQNQLSVEGLKARLVAEGLDYTRFRSNLRDELTLVRLREREVETRVRVSEAEIDQFLRERSAAVSNAPLMVNLAQILVAVPENATPQQVAQLQAKAQNALARVRAGEAFAKVAAEMSDAPDRAGGGELGLRPADRLPSLFMDATAQLAAGGLAGPVRSGAGFHVLKVVEKGRAAAVMTTVQTRARHILLRPSPQLSEQAIAQRLAEIRRRVETGQADFAELARNTSQDGSASAGGDLGWATPGMFVPEFEEAMNALAPGQMSQPLVSRFGVHLIQVMARREVPLTEREQREVARNAVQERKADEALTQWLQDVRGRAYVEMREPPQ